MAYNTMVKSKTSASQKARRERNKEVLSIVKEVCAEQGGMSDIGGGYVVVNTKHYEVRAR